MMLRKIVSGMAAVASFVAAGCSEEGVVKANSQPTLEVQASYTGREGELLAFNITVGDPDEADVVEVVAQLGELEGKANFANNAVTWTPDFKSARSEPYKITFNVTDKKETVEKSIAITIQDVNQKPVLHVPGAQNKREGEEVTFSVSATDDDTEDVVTVTWENPLAAPGNSEFVNNIFRWTPAFGQAGAYTLHFKAKDNHRLSPSDSVTDSVVINISDVNRKPFFSSAPVSRVFYENETATFTVRAEDSDAGQTVSVSMTDLNTPTTSATVQPSGAFSWVIPTGTKSTFNFKFTATDNGTPILTEDRTETVVVKLTNLPPVLEELSDRTVPEGGVLSFNVLGQAADPAEPDAATERAVQTLTYSMRPVGGLTLPVEATLNAITGAFSWNASCTAAGTYNVEFKVTDDGTPARSATRRIAIVASAANCGPNFTVFTRSEDGTSEPARAGNIVYSINEDSPLTVIARAVDNDGDNITYGVSGVLPLGASFNAATRTLSWRPNCTASATSPYTVVFTATDGIVGAPSQQAVRIDVTNVNCAPRFTNLCNTALSNPTDTSNVQCNATEGGQVSFSATALDGDSDNLSFSMGPANPKIPGSSFNVTTRLFTWRPGCNDAGSYNATFNVNDGSVTYSRTITFVVVAGACRPEFHALDVTQDGIPTSSLTIADADTEKTVNLKENEIASIVLKADSPEALSIAYGASGLPAGATFAQDAAAGTATIDWTTGCRTRGTYLVRLVATDDNASADRLTLKINVNETNCRPILAALAGRTVAENAALSVAVGSQASDPDLDALTDFTMAWAKDGSPTGVPAGSALDRATGAFSFAPGYSDSGSYVVTFTVDDHSAFGPAGSHTASQTMAITVTNTPRSPQFSALVVNTVTIPVAANDTAKDATIGENATSTIKLTATSPDGLSLSYSASGLPVGALLTGDTISWKPSCTAKGAYTVALTASDDSGRDQLNLAINVSETNCAPVLAAMPAQTVAEGRPLSFAAATYASDPDNDVLSSYTATWTKNGGAITQPATATFTAATGALSWTPTYGEAGIYVATLTVFDGSNFLPANLSASGALAIAVTHTALPPQFTSLVLTEGAGAPQTITVAAADTSKSASVDEAVGHTIRLAANSPESLPISYSASGLPAGASLAGDTITWTPLCIQKGNYTLSLVAADDTGRDTLTLSLAVDETNCAPVFAAIPPSVVAEGRLLTLNAKSYASDPDNDSLTTFSAAWKRAGATVTQPASASFNTTTGVLTWTPVSGEFAEYEVTFTVQDLATALPANLSAMATAAITVTKTNNPPLFTQMTVIRDGVADAPVTIAAGDTSKSATIAEATIDRIKLKANSPEALTVAYSASGLPTGASLVTDVGNGTGDIVWTPGCTQKGSYTVRVVATDANGIDAIDVNLTVDETNCAPGFAAAGSRSVAENATLSIDLRTLVTDPDNDNSSFWVFTDAWSGSAITRPGTATLSTSGLFQWTPGYAETGSYTVTFTVNDGSSFPPANSHTNTSTLTVTVTDTNRPPVVTFNPQGSGTGFDTYTVVEAGTRMFDVVGTDPDVGDTPTYSYAWANGTGTPISAPAGASLTGNAFSWTPDYTQAGSYQVTFTADDGKVNGRGTKTAFITVSPTDTAPTITIAPTTTPVTIDGSQNVAYSVTGRDVDGDMVTLTAASKAGTCSAGGFGVLASNTPGAGFTPTNGANFATGGFSWTPSAAQAGTYCVQFTAADGTGSDSANTMVQITVVDRAPTIAIAPTATSVTIDEGQTLNIAVTGRDVDGDLVTLSATGKSEACAGGAPFTALPVGNPTFTSTPGVNFASGAFNFAPDYTSAGTYCLRFEANDGTGSDTAAINVQIVVNDFDACANTYCPFGETCRSGACQVVFCSDSVECSGAESCNSGRCYLGHFLGRVPQPGEISTTNLFGNWPFNINANDVTPFLNHGTAIGTEVAGGYLSLGYRFTVNTSRVDVPDSASLNFALGPISLAAWIKTSDTAGSLVQSIVTKRGTAGVWYSMLLNNSGGLQLDFSGVTFADTRSLADGNWHHVVGVRDSIGTLPLGPQVRLYVDGVKVQEFVHSPTNVTNAMALQIGNFCDTGNNCSQPFLGEIDEVRVWGRALTDGEVGLFLGGAGTFRAGAAYAVAPRITPTPACNPSPGTCPPHSAYLALSMSPVADSSTDGSTCTPACTGGYICQASACVWPSPRSTNNILQPGMSEAQHTP